MSDYYAKKLFGRHDLLSKSAAQISQDVAKLSAEHTESLILEQLTELTKRGLLVIEETQPMLSMINILADQDAYELRITRGIRLVLKDQEYVESLEKKIVDLEAQVKTLDDNMFNILTSMDKEIFDKLVAMKQQKE